MATTYNNDGSVTIHVESPGYVSEYDIAMSPAWDNDTMSDDELIAHLRGQGYIVIEPTATDGFRYAAQPCPVCGQKSEARP